MKKVSLEGLIYALSLIKDGSLVAGKAKKLSETLELDKLPEGVPTRVEQSLGESESPISAKAVNELSRSINQFIANTNKVLTIQSGDQEFNYSPAIGKRILFESLPNEPSFLIDLESDNPVIKILIRDATQDSHGLFSKEDKKKLDGIQSTEEITAEEVRNLFNW